MADNQRDSDYASARGITAQQIIDALGYTPEIDADSSSIDGGSPSSPMIGTLDGGSPTSTYSVDEVMDGGTP